ncbi:MAG TPA: lasso peptide biosynthesis B2 protein [Anaerolineaceae bacterium]|nr:lasso peptide biosynthesis B2 protein [Anaerolineaceae bacterium]
MTLWKWSTDRLSRWRSLSPAERAVFLRALLFLPAVTLALRLLGLRRTRSLLSSISNQPVLPAPGPRCRWTDRPGRSTISNFAPSTIVRLVQAAGRQVPGATCLSASLLAWTLLRRQGVSTELRIGVRLLDGQFQAHSWLERSGQPLLPAPPDELPFLLLDLPLISGARTP